MNKSIALIGICILFISCHTVKVRTVPAFYFAQKTTIAIEQADVDETKSITELKYQLAQKGFNIVSLENAQKAIANPGKIIGKDHNNEIQEIYSIKDTHSVYKIVIGYRHFYDVFHYAYSKFQFWVVDLNTDKTVMWGHLFGDKSVEGTLKDLSEKLAKRVQAENKK